MDLNIYKNKLIKDLNLKLEFFTHIVPVPVVVYYATLSVFTFSKEYLHFSVFTILIYATIASILMLVMGIVLRIRKINKIFLNSDIVQIKYQLLQLPKFEAILIASRWFIGVIFAYIMIIISSFFYFKELPFSFLIMFIPFLGIPIFLSIIPLEMSSHYLIAENVIRKYIKNTVLKDIDIPTEKIKINFFIKILFYIISLVGLPLTILVSLMSLTYYFGTQLANPIIHFITLSIICLYPIIQTAYYIAKNFNEGLKQIQESLEKVANGNFKVKSGILSYDELGTFSQFINRIIQQLESMYDSIQTLNENLEKIVEIRTLELKNTLEEVQKLKLQQDGDYYLTTLLIEPFIRKSNDDFLISSKFHLDFIIKQKKEFEFRGKKKEIGGDFCSFYEINLKNKPYIFFINADAMGKSIQGAGGILILMSVLQAAIERNYLLDSEKNVFPEIWLKQLFIELHKILETFQGSMMISLILGLLDIQTNSLYFINAEHPSPVLIRKYKARFIKDKYFLRKLGSIITEGNISINTILLQKNDIFVCGSDGKDDIIYQDKLNEDESLFLRLLKKNNFSPLQTYYYIVENSEVKDDISYYGLKPSNKIFSKKILKKKK